MISILPLMLLAAPQGYSPEVEAVMDRARRQGEQERAARASVAAAEADAAAKMADGPLPLPPEIAAKLDACIDQANADPDAALATAAAWQGRGGGFHAQQCQGYAYTKLERWAPARLAFEQAASGADVARDPASAARLWAQSGNAALAGGDYAKAEAAFDAALARGLPDGLVKGETYLDRARARVAAGNPAGARADLAQALANAPADPLAWLLSATLARRMGDLKLAEAHIAEAARRAPDDASVALEQGNVAVMDGRNDAAAAAWKRAYALAPDSPAGKAADANLTELAAQSVAREAPLPDFDGPPVPASERTGMTPSAKTPSEARAGAAADTAAAPDQSR